MASAVPEQFRPIDFRTRFPALDGVRALAIVLVFAEHFGGGAHGGRILQFINILREHGWIGVDIFFVLSGFLITGILYDTLGDSKYISRFFARRSLRILPLYYGVFLLILLLTPFLHFQWRPQHLWFLVYLGNFVANRNFDLYLFFPTNYPRAPANISHFWSLCVEEQFYLVWPWIVLRVRNRTRLIAVAVALCALALLSRVLFLLWAGPVVAETWTLRVLPFRLDALLIGAILALLLRGPSAHRVQAACRWLFIGSALAVLAIFVLSPAYDSPWLLTIGLTLIGSASAGLVGMALRPATPVFRVCNLRPLRTLGKYSYGFYVFHDLYYYPCVLFLIWCYEHTHNRVLSGLVETVGAFIVTFLLSKLSYDLFESRFLRLKRHFEYDIEQTSHRHAFVAK